MAAPALWAKRPAMDVILAVTVEAICRKLQGRRILGGMARLARHLLMRASQRIFGLGRMIEAPARPAVRIVAGCTVGSETSLVPVIVAFFTREGRVFVGRRLVTFRTRDRSMKPDERKPCQVMVEPGLLSPTIFVMALLASRAERIFVWIIFLVT